MKTDLKHKFLCAIERHAMIRPGCAVLCGLSGGADSVALLHLLATYQAELGVAELVACHINHCLRGDESDRDEAFVRKICGELEVPLIVHQEDATALAKREGVSVEEGARRLRYRIFEEHCPSHGRIATAHTLSDSIETALLNLIRGTGLRGLAGIPPVRGSVIRPLIDCTRGDVEHYLSAQGIDYVTDSTNLSDQYTRNRIRHRILPEIAAINPDYEAVFARNFGLMTREVDTLDRLTQRALNEAALDTGYDCATLMRSDVGAVRLVYHWARGEGLFLDHNLCARCAQLLYKPSGKVQLPEGFTFYVHMGIAYLYRNKDHIAPEPITVQKASIQAAPLTVPFGTVKLTLSYFEKNGDVSAHLFSEKGLKNLLDYDKMSDILFLRAAGMQDKLTQPGRGVRKTVKKLLSDAHMPLHLRHGIPLIESGGKIAYVAGFGPDLWFAADTGTQRFIQVQCDSFTQT